MPGILNLEASGPALVQRASQLAPSCSLRPSPHPLPLYPHRAPSSQSNFRPQALAASSISPRPTASPGKTQGGPQPLVPHHRGRCPGRKAEVRKCPAPRRLPFRERGAAAASDSTSGLDHLGQDRGGRAERCSDLRGDFTLGPLGLVEDLQ